MTIAPSESYWLQVKSALPRLLSLLDRNPCSPTFGCFDRSYWLHRKTDFPASTAQMSLQTLALLYATPLPGNTLYRRPLVLAWIEGGLRFTFSLQHEDGSFDEWYPNERGWAGPTGYVTNAVVETLRLVESELAPETVAKAKRSLLLAASHLARRDEGEVLANHYAMALLAMTQVALKLEDPRLRSEVRVWRERFLALTCEEGWSLEYDGCDLGYALGTLDFLAQLHKASADPSLEDYARRAFRFLGYFAYPDGSWGGALGSRHTIHRYPFALEYWSAHVGEARPLLRHFREALGEEHDLAPQGQEDHYLHYRLAGYLQAALETFPGDLAPYRLPYQDPGFSMIRFPKAGFQIEKRGDAVLWTALRRGGAFRVHCLRTGKALAINDGCQVLRSDRRVLTSLWQSAAPSEGHGLAVKTPLQFLFTGHFTPTSFIAFRLLTAAMRSTRAAHLFKRLVRRVMIVRKRSSRSEWSRTLKWQGSRIELEDRIRWEEPVRWDALYWGGAFHSRYVPQAQYFSNSEVSFPPRAFQPGDFRDPARVRITSTLDTASGEMRVCAE